MKLYATTTSERATKGQGGNERLYTEISIEERNRVWVTINKSPTLGKNVYILSVKVKTSTGVKEITDTIYLIEQKGKSQKSEKCSQNHCNELNAVGGMCLEHYQLDL